MGGEGYTGSYQGGGEHTKFKLLPLKVWLTYKNKDNQQVMYKNVYAI